MTEIPKWLEELISRIPKHHRGAEWQRAMDTIDSLDDSLDARDLVAALIEEVERLSSTTWTHAASATQMEVSDE